MKNEEIRIYPMKSREVGIQPFVGLFHRVMSIRQRIIFERKCYFRSVFFLASCFLLLTTSSCFASSDPYPDRLGDFTTLNGFTDVYNKIYEDVNDIDERIVLERVGQYPDIFKENLTEEETTTLCNLDVNQVSYLKRFSKRDQVKISIRLQELCQKETELLNFQNSIARQNSIRQMFANNYLGDSPFDVINDWQEVDKIFFGEKFDDQKAELPSFAVYEKTKDFLIEPEYWQNQQEKTLANEFGGAFKSRNYKDFFASITGNLAGLHEPLKMLLSYNLVGGKSTKSFFELASHAGSSTEPGGAGTYLAEVTASDTSQTESEITQEERTSSTFLPELLDVECPQYVTERGLASDDLDVFFQCQKARGESFYTRLEDVEKETLFQNILSHFSKINSQFSSWNSLLVSFRESLIEIQDILKDFLTKPQN